MPCHGMIPQVSSPHHNIIFKGIIIKAFKYKSNKKIETKSRILKDRCLQKLKLLLHQIIVFLTPKKSFSALKTQNFEPM
jgi:hypothetical protein